jgi:hypothetical protein
VRDTVRCPACAAMGPVYALERFADARVVDRT